jgi:hypothetical protein
MAVVMSKKRSKRCVHGVCGRKNMIVCMSIPATAETNRRRRSIDSVGQAIFAIFRITIVSYCRFFMLTFFKVWKVSV